jgi:TldD protein
MRHEIDAAFLELPLERLAHTALTRAGELGAKHTSIHIIRTLTGRLRLYDGIVQSGSDSIDTALGVRLVRDGSWGYAATVELTANAAARTAAEAVEVATACRPLGRSAMTLADEGVYPGAVWVSSYDVDPFQVPEAERVALLADRSQQLLVSPHVQHVAALFTAVRENRYYADAAGTEVTQQRVRVHPMFTAFGVSAGGTVESLRTSAPPTGRGWEYLMGSGWDWDAELAELPIELAAKMRARPVKPGIYDLVIDASNLWLVIHETVGHASELDRALGYEASYAGTTFLTPDAPGTLHFGSPLMNVTADRVSEHGLATIGFDDEGVPAQSWELVRDGLLVGLQTDRTTAALTGAPRSTGCSYADSALRPPLARMPNVSLQAAVAGPDVAGLVAGVDNGIYLAGSSSWSIDSQREHFQFTAQRSQRIQSGRLAGHLSGVAFQGSTTRFWGSLAALGSEATYGLFGADLCGKGQPVQIAAASHGCPAATFCGIRVEQAGAGLRS